jgi:hypothetical protein
MEQLLCSRWKAHLFKVGVFESIDGTEPAISGKWRRHV